MNGFLYHGYTWENVLAGIGVLLVLILLNEVTRRHKLSGMAVFIALPIILTVLVWPTTAAPGNEYGTGTWFNWVKTYSALAGVLGFMYMRYNPKIMEKKWILIFPPAILGINIFEAVLRDFEIYSMAIAAPLAGDPLGLMSGPWNIMNGVAGILNILLMCGWVGIYISKGKSKDMIWPDMIWAWIIAYDLWNFSYTYNCITDHSFYCGVALLLACTIPAFFFKKGAWLQHRAATLALWIMFIMTVPMFADSEMFKVYGSHDPVAHYVVAGLSLVANVALAIYQVYRMIKLKQNPLKDEIYKGTSAYVTGE